VDPDVDVEPPVEPLSLVDPDWLVPWDVDDDSDPLPVCDEVVDSVFVLAADPEVDVSRVGVALDVVEAPVEDAGLALVDPCRFVVADVPPSETALGTSPSSASPHWAAATPETSATAIETHADRPCTRYLLTLTSCGNWQEESSCQIGR
jgi:hypothetical protein